MESEIFVIIIIICVALILFAIAKHNYKIIVNFILRILGGAACIIIFNFILSFLQLSMEVSINGSTILVSGLFGIPGIVLLYALATYFHFS